MKEFSESGGVYGGDERFSKGQSRSSSTSSNWGNNFFGYSFLSSVVMNFFLKSQTYDM